MLVIGTVYSRKVKTSVDFALAGRNLGWVLVMCAGAATQTGAAATLTVVGLTYEFGAHAIWWQISNAIVFILFAFTVAKPFHASGVKSIGMFAEKYYDKKNRVLISTITAVQGIGYTAAQIAGMATLINGLTPLSFASAAVIGGAVVLVYTFLGGLYAVCVTDVVQLAIVFIGMIATIFCCLSLFGGTEALAETIGRDQFSPIWTQFAGSSAPSFMWFLSMCLSWFVARLTAQNFFMFSGGSRNERTAFIGSVTGGAWPIIFGIMAVLIGLYSKAYLPPDIIGQAAMPYLISDVMPPIIAAALIAGIAAACMSTADSNLNGAVVTISEEAGAIFKLSDKQLLSWSRVITVIVGVLSILLVIKLQSIYTLLTFSFDFGAPLTPALLAAVYWKKCSPTAALWSILIGFVCTVYFKYGMPEYAAIVMPVWIGSIISTAVLIIVTFIAPRKEAKAEVNTDSSAI
jgi:SSS family solute:Na+ symporter